MIILEIEGKLIFFKGKSDFLEFIRKYGLKEGEYRIYYWED